MFPDLHNIINSPPQFTPESNTHLWLLDMAQLHEQQIQNHTTCLPADELARAQRFIRNPSAAIATRIFVRLCLASYLKTTPQSLVFAAEKKGKPYIESPATTLQFNLSHTDKMALIAVSEKNAVGVDIEKTARNSDILSIAENFFNAQEFNQLKSKPVHEQQKFFFKLWTLKEAFLKATGDGIAVGLEKVSFTLDDDAINVCLATELNVQKGDWKFYQTFISQDLCVAVAKQQSAPLQIQWFNGNHLFL